MDRREFIAAAGTAAALASASQAFAQAGEEPMMHPPKYKVLEEATAHCVATGNDCLRHCLGMYSMKNASMAGCANSAFQLVAACAALQTLAAVNSEHTGHFAKVVDRIHDPLVSGLHFTPDLGLQGLPERVREVA